MQNLPSKYVKKVIEIRHCRLGVNGMQTRKIFKNAKFGKFSVQSHFSV